MNCADCNVPMTDEAGKCRLCMAFDNGQVVFWESMRFHVTAGRIADLLEWHDGHWIPSEILDTEIALTDRRFSPDSTPVRLRRTCL